MKYRYTLKDNKTGGIFTYTKLQWDMAWAIVYILGIIVGIIMGILITQNI